MLYVIFVLLFLFIAAFIFVLIRVQANRRAKRHQELLAVISQLKPQVQAAFAEVSLYYNFGHYITESERLMLVGKYEKLDMALKRASSSRQANAAQPQPERSSAPVGVAWKWPHCVVTKKPWIAPGLPFVRVSSIPRTFQNVVSKIAF